MRRPCVTHTSSKRPALLLLTAYQSNLCIIAGLTSTGINSLPDLTQSQALFNHKFYPVFVYCLLQI